MCVCVEFWKIETKAELKVYERINEYEAFKNEKKIAPRDEKTVIGWKDVNLYRN